MFRGERLQSRRVVGIRQHKEFIPCLQSEVVARRNLLRAAAHIDKHAAGWPERLGDLSAIENRLDAD